MCLDTCHIFQAGYNLNNNQILNNVFKILKPIQHKIKLIHMNDSVNDYGSGIDRHEKIGYGKINVKQLKKIINTYNIPMILETNPPYEEQIKKII